MELISRMVGELILDHDSVGLPGIGTFVAETVPAYFSDRGYTINPPYRRLNFRKDAGDDNLLAGCYAAANGVDTATAGNILRDYLAGQKLVLHNDKSLLFPSLGKLRVTRDGDYFFVCSESLDIFPEGTGLEPVSLKTHDLAPAPPVQVPLDEVQAAPEERQDSPVGASPAPPVQVPLDIDGGSETVRRPPHTPGTGLNPFAVIVITLLATALFALGAFIIAAHVAPDFIDSILYTPEELKIINYD